MAAESRIRVLSSVVINKIAAGEVVERPASVLKELIENSIDAGATRIEVSVAAGGRKLVSVSDNGAGMPRDDALLSIERHATSKIRDVDDIENIATLGFRGEALAAIASVSRFRLVTCAAGETAGTEVVSAGGVIQDVRETGFPAGALIEVRDLFFNVPARRKFLRSHATELGHLRSGFILQALAHPSVAMTLTVDGRAADRLPGNAELRDRIRDIFGAELLARLRLIERERRGVRVSGFAGLPALARTDRAEQFVFVNGRPTGAPVLAGAIREAYHGLAAPGSFPALFLFVNVDPGDVDVNVHPMKREVRFRDSASVRDAVIEGIRGALGSRAASPAPGSRAGVGGIEEAPAQKPPELAIDDLPPTRTFRYPGLPQIPLAGAPAVPTSAAGGAPPPAPDSGLPETRAGAAPWSWCRVLGQVGGLYAVLETEDGLVLMDPHAAHERVMFERFMKAFESGPVPMQKLLMPENVRMQPGDASRVRAGMKAMNEMGFSVSDFGGDSFIVDGLPALFAGATASGILLEVARHLEQAGARGGGKTRWREDAIARAACKAAVKARDRLSLGEIERLVIDLAGAAMPYTCPHGRPTLIFMSFNELHRKFGRE